MPDTTFIWKYEDLNDKFTEGIENVYLGDWLPQNELLADKRLNVFVTHGGLGSVTELSMMGTPAVMVRGFNWKLQQYLKEISNFRSHSLLINPEMVKCLNVTEG